MSMMDFPQKINYQRRLLLDVCSNINRQSLDMVKGVGSSDKALYYRHTLCCPSTSVAHLDANSHLTATVMKSDKQGPKPQKPQEKENFLPLSCSCHSDKSCLYACHCLNALDRFSSPFSIFQLHWPSFTTPGLSLGNSFCLHPVSI